MIDVNEKINAVRRQVGKRVLEAGEARVQTISQVYDTTLEDLWDACTKPERIARWFLPVTGDLQVGGRYQFEGNAGGTVERCDPPKGFAATWEYGTEVSWIEVRLTGEPTGGTRFELDHIAHVDDERWAQYGPGATGVGWDLGFIGLGLHLASGGAPVDPAAVEAWSTSDDGRQFITLSSQRWADAAIEAGEDPTAAKAAAGRTTAFYTGAPEDAAGAEAPAE
ncbi:SRPBCC family protein [Micromonospora sp. NBC_01796]|uniref:SRPBCC family protein n=1 Tax=Micromonospora sp. NBC_01796 TaxID=2975987 RepID=UPI002DDAB99C|nr:SRPBCC family protein [Micromonospora sp. NBC_01796]WSA83024.1 SRPBCC family protein [Micromonospora sp. NBC_01796]